MNLTFDLLRDIRTSRCTSGVLTLPAGAKLFTIERPWIPNPFGGKSGKRFESCVSDGSYRLIPHNSEKFGSVWAVINPALDVYYQPGDVPNARADQCRFAILIHAGNYWHDVIGCIAPGKQRVRDGSEWMVTHSRAAMNDLKTAIGSKLDLTLNIRWADGLQP